MPRLDDVRVPNLLEIIGDVCVDHPGWLALPPSEKAANRLADALFCLDEVLFWLSGEYATAAMRSAEEDARDVYDRLNELVKRFSD